MGGSYGGCCDASSELTFHARRVRVRRRHRRAVEPPDALELDPALLGAGARGLHQAHRRPPHRGWQEAPDRALAPHPSRGDQQRPLLIGQGANDPRVKQAEADQIVKAMLTEEPAGHLYMPYPDEGHGFARPENRLSFNAVAEVFLAEHLGGSYQPAADDFKGSSITVPSGVENRSSALTKAGARRRNRCEASDAEPPGAGSRERTATPAGCAIRAVATPARIRQPSQTIGGAGELAASTVLSPRVAGG